MHFLRLISVDLFLTVSECEGKDTPMEVDAPAEKPEVAKASNLTTENPNLTASQSSLRSQPDYDSSATLSADEGPGGPSHMTTARRETVSKIAIEQIIL